jgi:hypothetical protein
VPVHLDVGDAVVVDETAHDCPQLGQATATPLADAFGEFLPGGADIACGIDEFVVPGAGPGADVEQRLLRPGGAVAGEQVVDVVRIWCG